MIIRLFVRNLNFEARIKFSNSQNCFLKIFGIVKFNSGLFQVSLLKSFDPQRINVKIIIKSLMITRPCTDNISGIKVYCYIKVIII